MAKQPVTFDIRGIDTAMKNLKDLDQKAARRVVTAAVRAGSKVVVKEARSRAPVRSGKLKRNIRTQLKRNKISGTITARVRAKPTTKQKEAGLGAWYAHMVIAGSKPHPIPNPNSKRKPRRKKQTKPEGAGTYNVVVKVGDKVYRHVSHPGIKSNDFMLSAAHAAYQPSLTAFEAKYKEAWDKELAKLPKQ